LECPEDIPPCRVVHNRFRSEPGGQGGSAPSRCAAQRQSSLTRGLVHPDRSRDCPLVGSGRAPRSSPFWGEVGIDPRAEPTLLRAPAQPFSVQHCMNTAPLDVDPFLRIEVALQPLKRPRAEGLTAEGLPELLGVREVRSPLRCPPPRGSRS
jgi:hypothetical protein